MICIFTHTIYGYSGNELPPSSIGGGSYIEQANPDESGEDFKIRMQKLGMKLRSDAKALPIKPYSRSDSVDWMYYEDRPVRELEELLND